jgi:hypothetical protein
VLPTSRRLERLVMVFMGQPRRAMNRTAYRAAYDDLARQARLAA